MRNLIRRLFWSSERRANLELFKQQEDGPFDEETASMLELSLSLFNRMRSQGLALTKERYVSHLFIGTDKNIRRAARAFLQPHYEVVEQGEGRLLITEQAIISESWVREKIPAMCLIAGEFDLEYDGWDVDVAKDHTGQDN